MKSFYSFKKALVLQVLSLASIVTMYGQAEWAWISGPNAPNVAGVYGTRGVPDVNNLPAGRYNQSMWADKAGNVWIFGGGTNTGARFNDLWRYNPSTKQWTWMHGTNGQNPLGTYATARGVASPLNTPGGRHFFSKWIDKDGNFWMFGGQGFAASGSSTDLNDLWKYSPVTEQWTWMKGDSSRLNQAASYGTMGITASTNIPGGRRGGITWVDSTGNLWLFGGYGVGASGSGFLNDLWKYDIATNNWTWVSGPNTVNGVGTYGTKGVGSASNTPGARQTAAAWVDDAGNFWLFGGQGNAAVATARRILNDLWKYNPSNGQWTWVNGSDVVDAFGVYGDKGVASATNSPGARQCNAFWKDGDGNFWLFGGGYAFGSSGTWGNMNDLWKYDLTSNQWTWFNGDSIKVQPGIYGTQGVPSTANTPGSRSASGCMDDNGNMWLFGGYGPGAVLGNGLLNDLWKLEVCTQPRQPGDIIGPEFVCAGSSEVYSIPKVTGATSYIWTLPDGWAGSSTSDSIAVASGTEGGLITVMAINGCDSSVIQSFEVGIYPIEAIITTDGFILSTTDNYRTYQWFRNGILISGATSRQYTVTQNGDYTVAVEDEHGCKDTSDIYTVTNAEENSIATPEEIARQIEVYPNPAHDFVTITAPVPVDLLITSIEGKTIKHIKQSTSFSVKGMASGIYLIRIIDREGNLLKTEKLIKSTSN